MLRRCAIMGAMTGSATERLGSAHALPGDEVAAALGVDRAVGLDPDEVRRRAASSGPNALEPARRTSIASMVWDAATEPFVLLLLVAGALAVALGEVRDGLLILGGLVPIVGADVVTEYRGDRALEALRDAAAPRARVRRSGEVDEINATELVPGDIVLLHAGDVVPADLRLLRAERLLLDRSALTGESVPDAATAGPDAPDAALADRHAMAYAARAWSADGARAWSWPSGGRRNSGGSPAGWHPASGVAHHPKSRAGSTRRIRWRSPSA
jgi:magnesium-transporting ATPase (P-type)